MMRHALVAVVVTFALAAVAAGEMVTLAPPGQVIAYGKSGEYVLKAPEGYKSARLMLSVRMDAPECSGSTHVLRMRINGKMVMGALDRAHCRLLNKPMVAKMASGLEIPWVRDADWRVVYAPDFEILGTDKAGASRILNASAYRLVLDVTDLIERGQENKLLLEHLGEAVKLRSYFPKTNPSLDFVLNELAVDFSQEPGIGGTARPENTEEFSADRLMVQPPATVDVSKVVTIQPGGGFRIDLPGMPLQVVSRFSYQGGGFNVLADEARTEGQPEWKVTTNRTGDEGQVVATAKEYRLERSVRFAGDHLQITDRLTNLTDEAIGLAFDNRLTAPGGAIVDAWLGGNPDPAVNKMEALENNSVFVAGRQSGCGLLAVDDVYRIQSILTYDQGAGPVPTSWYGAGARSNTFALGPKDSYAVRWNLYPVLRADYYDFINLARRDLDVNFTVPGGFQFGLGAKTDDDYRAMAEQRGLKFMSSGVWMDPAGPVKCYHGEHMLQATAQQQRLRENCAAIRRAIPQVKSLIYIHSYINTDPAGPQKHPDARITNEDGTPYENEGYTKQCGITFWYNYPALDPENSYVAAMRRVIDMCLDRDKIGADGTAPNAVRAAELARRLLGLHVDQEDAK